jgi:hypothetical protein
MEKAGGLWFDSTFEPQILPILNPIYSGNYQQKTLAQKWGCLFLFLLTKLLNSIVETMSVRNYNKTHELTP